MMRAVLGLMLGICLSAYAETMNVSPILLLCSGDLTGTYPNCIVGTVNGLSLASIATSGSASDLGAGTLPSGRMPAHSGDCTSSAGTTALTCTKTNGVSLGTAATTNTGASGASVPLLNAQNTWSAPQVLPKSTISGLPTCNAGLEGAHYGVTDALLPAALAVVAAGGAVHVNVYCNGTSWIVG